MDNVRLQIQRFRDNQPTGDCPHCHVRSGVVVCPKHGQDENALPTPGQALVCMKCTGFLTISDKRELVALELDQIPGDDLIGALETRRLAVKLAQFGPDVLQKVLQKGGEAGCTCGHEISDHKQVGDETVCVKCTA